jgi:hypothetical protein
MESMRPVMAGFSGTRSSHRSDTLNLRADTILPRHGVAALNLAPLAAGESHMAELSRALMRSWPRTSSQRVVPANAGTHHLWPQK